MKQSNRNIYIAVAIMVILTVFALSMSVVYARAEYLEYERAVVRETMAAIAVTEPPMATVAPKSSSIIVVPVAEVTIDEEEETLPEEYTVVKGDSFWGITQKFYGNGNLYLGLVGANNLSVDSVIIPGQKLILPENIDEHYKKMKVEEELRLKEEEAARRASVPASRGNVQQRTDGYIVPGTLTSTGAILDIYNQTVTHADTSNMTYIGKHFITGYTPTCSHCCGKANGITASGKLATIDRTIAMKGYAFGTEVYIEGYGFYVVEDRGVGKGIIDIARLTHSDCGTVTKKNIDVYIVN